MKGAIFYTSKHGSTAEYSKWISEATGLPFYEINDKSKCIKDFDFLVIGSPIYYYKLLNRKWLKKHASEILKKPTILFTVSGAPAGDKLNSWLSESHLPENLLSALTHIALRGRQIPEELSWFERLMLKIAASNNPDPIAREEELNGFDYMDKTSIEPIIEHVNNIIEEHVSKMVD